MNEVRVERINAEVKRTLSGIMSDRQSRYPQNMISVMRVQVTNDLRHANIYISIFGADGDRIFDEIVADTKGIRQLLASQMRSLRIIPELHIKRDTTLDYSEKINTLIEKTKKED